jgi:TolA-binding protein
MTSSNDSDNNSWLIQLGERVWAIRGIAMMIAATILGTMAWTKWNQRVAQIPDNVTKIQKNRQRIQNAQNRLDKLNEELEEMNQNIRIALCTQKEDLSETARVHLGCSQFN